MPAAAALALGLVLGRVLPWPWSQRYALPAALAGSFALGYVLLPDWAPLVPERHWHWLPWLGLAAALVAGVRFADGVVAGERWLLAALLGVVVAWFIVPTWPDLQPSRPWSIMLLTGYIAVLAVLLEQLPDRLRGRLFCGILALVAAGLALAVGAAVSGKYAQLAGIAMAGLWGCCFAGFRGGEFRLIRGLVLVYAVLVGAIAYAGYVEPSPPLTAAMLIPATPLTVWLIACGPLAQLNGWRMMAAQVAVVLVPLAILVGWAVLRGGIGDGY